LALDDPGGQDGRRQRPRGIAEPMLPELCDLDPGQRTERPAGSAELDPGDLRVTLPTDAPEEARPLAEQPALGPRRVPPERVGCGPRVGEGIAAGPTAEVRPPPRRPPRPVVVGHHGNAPAMLRDAMGGRARLGPAGRLEGGLDA